MPLFHWIAGGLLGALWFYRLTDTAFGIHKVADITRPEWTPETGEWANAPLVTIVVPAKDEAEGIEKCLTSLLNLDYPNYEIIAVDDRSSDATGAIMNRVQAAQTPVANGERRLRIIHVTELPSGWLGKTHAMWLAAKQGRGEWILFTDGDVVFRPDSFSRAMKYALKSGADHLVLFPTPLMYTPGERMVMSFLQIMFIFSLRAWKISDPDAHDFIGVGAFNLIRKPVYEALGTYEALRMEVVDDMMLGKKVKKNGFLQHNVFGHGLISLHWAKGALGIAGNLTKNIFSLMLYRWPLALIAALGLFYISVWPFIGIWFAQGMARSGYVVALASIALLYGVMAKYSKVSALYFLTHPISAALFVFTILRSTWLVLSQGGVTWRGTKYSVDELRNAGN